MPRPRDRIYKKRKNGRPHGPWYGWFYPRGSKTAVYVCLGTDNRAAAVARLREYERGEIARADPTANQTEAVTLLDVLAALIDAKLDVGAPTGTVEMHTEKGRHLVRKLGADTDITTLTAQRLRRYVGERRSEGAAAGTIAKELVTLRGALKQAHVERKVAEDLTPIVPKLPNTYQPRRRHLSADEFAALLAALPQARRLWVMIAVYAGPRSSTIEAMSWDEHVDLTAGWLYLPGTKTRGSALHLPIHLALGTELANVQKKDRVGPVVQPWGNVRRDLHAACERAEIPHCSPNDLRRTFASWLKQAGEDSMVVAKMMGHTTSRMVEQTYGHLTNREFQRAIDRLPAPPPASSNRVVNSAAKAARMSRMPRDAAAQGRETTSNVVPRGGIEPPTRGFSVRCSTN
jgi:integrase